MARFSRVALLIGAAAAGSAGFASVAQAAPLPDHYYELQGTFADGANPNGPALTPTTGAGTNGSFQGTGYAFVDNRGLKLNGALDNVGTYTIVLDFRFNDVAQYQKVVHFKENMQVDAGVYVIDGDLRFYGAGLPASATTDDDNEFSADSSLKRVVLTRDAASEIVTGYVNGVQQFRGDDNGAGSATNGLLFFQDNSLDSEAEPGFVERIAVYNRVLNDAERNLLGGSPVAIPEPTTGVLLAAAGAGLLLRRRRTA